MIRTTILLLIFSTLLISGCQNDASKETEEFQVNVRLASEPDNLHPMLSRSAQATQIENLILYPLAEFDPYSLELSPLIIESIPVAFLQESGPQAGLYLYDMKIRAEAVWEDGVPITAEDYLFTLKAAFNPKVNVPTWRGFLNDVKVIQIDPSDSKHFQVYLDGKNMLSDLTVVNFNIFPKHIYDPKGFMDLTTLDQLRSDSSVDSLIAAIPQIEEFAASFTGVQYNRDTISGAGPYKMVNWTTGESITLEKKENWWGEKVANRPHMMNAFPQRIIYSFVPDENTALTAMKDGSFDVMSGVSSDAYLNLKDDAAYTDQLDFYTPSLMQYHYLELNNRNPKLADIGVRKALAATLDYDALIENLTSGLAQKTIGPIHPVKPYYNKNVTMPSQDLELATKLLEEAGWSDSNGDGTVDKMIDGKRTELELSVLVSQRQEGQQLALILKQSAARAGININIETADGARIVGSLRNRDFEILPLRSRSNPAVYDPYQTWHSSSDQPGGGNRSGYRDEEVDQIIEEIREENDPARISQLYLDFQRELAEDQPVIFLYVPLEKIIVNERFKVQPSVRRPGYFENLFQLSSD